MEEKALSSKEIAGLFSLAIFAAVCMRIFEFAFQFNFLTCTVDAIMMLAFLASLGAVLAIPLYPVYVAGRRSLAHAGLAIVIWSFLAGMATALMSIRC
ncbi:MAG: hypothetical protein AB7W16_01790 [Candidatus Obscuribacterales bacterium]